MRKSGYIVGQSIHINAFQAADIDVTSKQAAAGTGVATSTLDFQKIDDPVINNPVRLSPGSIKADVLIRINSPSDRSSANVHAGPIWNAKETWNVIDSRRSGFDVNKWVKEVTSKNPLIKVNIE